MAIESSPEREVYEAKKIDGLATDVAAHGARLDAQDHLISTKVAKDAFEPIKYAVYAVMSTVAAAVLAAALHMIGIKSGS